MLKMLFDNEGFGDFSNDERTPLHFASENGNLKIVKYLNEKGADVYSIWKPQKLCYRKNILTLINNFNDPFYQRSSGFDTIRKLQINVLENGMICMNIE